MLVERRRTFVVALLVLLVPAICVADDPREPGVVTLRSGGMSVELQRAHAWTVQAITFRGVPVVTRTGACGALACIPVAGGWVGSAHTAGGVEQVEEISLTVDGEAAGLTDGAAYTGERIVLQKRSMLDKLRLNATLTLAGGVLTERTELTATEDVIVTTVYPFMYCVTAETTDWIAATLEDEEQSGSFGAGGELEWREGWSWTAAYIPQRSTGLVVRHLAQTEQAATLTGYWDQERYHKLYVRWDVPEDRWQEGFSLAGEIALTCFEAPAAGWQEMARQVASELVAE